jgi:AcrR family transcriptional regulator
MSVSVITYTGAMGRWEPGASGRLRAAAMELYVERGFEQTTVADIAERAGLTGRTFFRHFADKREVLFAGSADLQDHLVDALENAPASATPIEAVRAALAIAAEILGGNHDYSRQRQTVIMANAELQERELMKMASLSAAFAEGLRQRGVTDPDASLVAELGVAIFQVSFRLWVTGSGDRGLDDIMRSSLDQMKVLAATG